MGEGVYSALDRLGAVPTRSNTRTLAFRDIRFRISLPLKRTSSYVLTGFSAIRSAYSFWSRSVQGGRMNIAISHKNELFRSYLHLRSISSVTGDPSLSETSHFQVKLSAYLSMSFSTDHVESAGQSLVHPVSITGILGSMNLV